ncbi:universal stress protein [Novosphingobium flavum]|uniref:Universal stress protein n=1 Tax=Novosphingobium flavum TaxID=1778672 RepID=A0A7X1FQJ9_9SPHN|nr:universal stress protein [Novosphingobium flavum]MBC2665108.1 universal stress protein [Novosphingobium flavum]
MRSILVHAEPGPAGSIRIDSALSLARMTGGHVTLLVDTPVTRYIAVDAMGGGTVAAEAIHEAVAEDDAFARTIEGQVARGDVPCDIVRVEADPIDALSDAARLADVVVVARGAVVAGDLPLSTRCPVLAVNAEEPLIFPIEKACVAWDGSAEAAHALRGAVPILAACGEVIVLTVEDAPAEFPATDALAYLSRHGVGAELQVVQRIGSVEDTISRELELNQAQLLVMGAFSHSRLREFLFGGVTRHFLEQAGGPALLLAH